MISINQINYSENKSWLSMPITNKYESNEIKNDHFEISKFMTKSMIWKLKSKEKMKSLGQ